MRGEGRDLRVWVWGLNVYRLALRIRILVLKVEG